MNDESAFPAHPAQRHLRSSRWRHRETFHNQPQFQKYLRLENTRISIAIIRPTLAVAAKARFQRACRHRSYQKFRRSTNNESRKSSSTPSTIPRTAAIRSISWPSAPPAVLSGCAALKWPSRHPFIEAQTVSFLKTPALVRTRNCWSLRPHGRTSPRRRQSKPAQVWTRRNWYSR